MDKETELTWLAVIGRSLAYLVLHNSAAANGTAKDKAVLLNSLGIPVEEIAALLKTTPNSIGNMLRAGRKGRHRGKN